MFGREFTGKGHRQHVLPPSPTRYSFEKVGSTREALGLSGLSVGDEVYWYSGGDDVDTSASGVIVEFPAVDPDGMIHSDMAGVEWSDDGYDIVEIDNLLNAEHYNIGQGYSQALGSRKQADAYMDELKEWYPVEYDAFMESLGPGTVYEPGELESIHKQWVKTQDPFDEGGDSYSASRRTASEWSEEYDGTWFIRFPGDVVGSLTPSDDPDASGLYHASAEVDREDDFRELVNTHGVTLEEGKRLIEDAAAQVTGSRKQASSLTWEHETAEQSMLDEEIWFAYSGDGFHASVAEESPGSGRFTVDAFTDSDLYKYLSTTEHGFESVDEAKGFVEQVFGHSRVAAKKEDLREGQQVSVGGRNGRISEIRGDRITVAFPGEGVDFFSAGQINTVLASRTAGKCSKCDGMGRETYETDTGSLSTQTCKACGGTGQAKESARRTAQWFTNTDRMGDSYKTTFDPSRGNEFQSDEPVARVGERPRSDDKPSKWAWEVWLPGGHPMGSGGVAPAVPELGNEETEEEALRKAEQAMSRYAFRKASAVTWYDQSDQFGGMWSTYQGSAPDSPNGQISESNGTYRWYVSDSGTRGNQQTGESSSLDEAKREAESALASLGVTASRTAPHRTAFLDTVHFAEPRHRVAGWDWDDHLNGFLAAEAAREFTCACGESVPAPGYVDCRCGKRWNCYTISANGAQKMIAREVPVRDGVVMANRRTAAGTGWETPPVDLGTLSDEELREFVFNVQHAIDSGANIGTIMENKKSHFRDELVRRGWRVDGMGYPYKE